MHNTYRLATLSHIGGKPQSVTRKCFGPMLTLAQAEHWQRELTAAGKQVVIVNVESV